MLSIKKLTYSPFAENTYLLYNEEKQAWIIDPGCYEQTEKDDLREQINSLDLKPVKLINTHCHLDHIFGNAWVHREYDLLPIVPEKDLALMEQAKVHAQLYGITGFEASPTPSDYLIDGSSLFLGDDEVQIIEVAGHTPGHVVLYVPEQQFLIGGDVLFDGSIGRTDLPGGNHDQLLTNIRERLYVLEDEVVVYSGHGAETTIGKEKNSNPFVRA